MQAASTPASGACVRRHRARQGQSRRRDGVAGRSVRIGRNGLSWCPQRSMNTLRTGISMPITKIPVTILRVEPGRSRRRSYLSRRRFGDSQRGDRFPAGIGRTLRTVAWRKRFIQVRRLVGRNAGGKAVQPAYGIDLASVSSVNTTSFCNVTGRRITTGTKRFTFRCSGRSGPPNRRIL